ncbi:hypothetical protein CK203_093467 [Vitis vinifera]|uniref:Uncharacterized protein n=1 Tax=Vitis vinifera TaxID=29760 RepID=A0A438BNA8_VITVI|nr:hypothetical protein CK203_093467 [Vitis vinifera]
MNCKELSKKGSRHCSILVISKQEGLGDGVWIDKIPDLLGGVVALPTAVTHSCAVQSGEKIMQYGQSIDDEEASKVKFHAFWVQLKWPLGLRNCKETFFGKVLGKGKKSPSLLGSCVQTEKGWRIGVRDNLLKE